MSTGSRIQETNGWSREATLEQLKQYLDRGLTPIPLIGKRPLVRWKEWDPQDITALQRYVTPGVNWAVRTGSKLSVIDFDDEESFIDFTDKNGNQLPKDTPIVKTGCGYHIWFRPIRPLRNQSFEKVDIKGTGGYVVAPPSIHENGEQYRFIKPICGAIPLLDIDTLDWSGVASKEYQNHFGDPTNQENGDPWALEEGFSWEPYKDGVKKGQRHTILVKYIRWLIKQGYAKAQAKVLIDEWNAKNHPPLDQAEVKYTLDSCWQEWGDEDVHTKTSTTNNKVRDKTGLSSQPLSNPFSYPSHEQRVTREDWDLEEDPPPYRVCAAKVATIRRGRYYRSLNFFCGRWSCVHCGPFFKNRWIDHIAKKARGQDLHCLYCRMEDWGRVHKAINRQRVDYLCIRRGSTMVVLLSKPMENTSILRSYEVKGFLGVAIPEQALSCPVFASRGWERSPCLPAGWRIVTRSWVPSPIQLEIAESLGATPIPVRIHPEFVRAPYPEETPPAYFDRSWLAPEDVDEDKWERAFVKEVRLVEREMRARQWVIACG